MNVSTRYRTGIINFMMDSKIHFILNIGLLFASFEQNVTKWLFCCHQSIDLLEICNMNTSVACNDIRMLCMFFFTIMAFKLINKAVKQHNSV